MDNKKRRDAVQNIPEKSIRPVKEKKDAIKEKIDKLKTETGIDFEPVKNSKYKLERVKNHLLGRYEFRYNLFAKRPEIKSKTRDEFEYFDERSLDNLYNELEYDANIPIGQNRLLSFIGSDIISPDYDPIMDYLNSLPKWDGKDRFPMFLTQIKLNNESENRDFLIKYFKKWFVTMVGSLCDKDITNEVAIVFTGEEGRGKTRFFISLVPEHLRLKYLFVGNFNPRDKDHLEMLGTKMIIFLDEMATLTRTDSETLKTTMSQRYVVLRRAYGRGNIHLYRRASFAGAINDDQFLTDQGANRRWLPFAIDSIDIDQDFDIDLLYAQALELYKTKGFDLYYDRDEIDQLKLRNEQFRRRAPEEELILLHWRAPSEQEVRDHAPGLQYLTAADVMYELSSMDIYKKMNANDTVSKRIGRTLKALGFPQIKKRIQKYNSPRDCFVLRPIDSYNIQNIKKGTGFEDQEESEII